MTTLAQDLKELKRLKKVKEEAKQASTDAELEFRVFQNQVYERMIREEADSQKTDGTLFVRQTTPYGVINDLEAFMAWARENEPELIYDTFLKSRLNEMAKLNLDDGVPLPPGMALNVKEYVAQRKAR